jgi:thioredoxin-dependent peroxiredoxin
MTLKVGDKAPDFSLPSASGETVTLASLRGKPAVIYFYPKDDTPGCTVEACTFRDMSEDFERAGARVLGVSSDSVASHGRFAAKHKLPMTLLSDEGGKLRALFGVKKTLGILPGRATFVLDQDGVVRLVFASQLEVRRHANEALAMLRSLAGPGAAANP